MGVGTGRAKGRICSGLASVRTATHTENLPSYLQPSWLGFANSHSDVAVAAAPGAIFAEPIP